MAGECLLLGETQVSLEDDKRFDALIGLLDSIIA
jgi:hypothetical protein